MSYAIRFRNPRQIDEAGMILVPRGRQIAMERARLEGCGYVVIGIEPYPAAWAEAEAGDRSLSAAPIFQGPFSVE